MFETIINTLFLSWKKWKCLERNLSLLLKEESSKKRAKSDILFLWHFFSFLTFSVLACNTMVLTESPQTQRDKSRIYIRVMHPCSPCDNYTRWVSKQMEKTTGNTCPAVPPLLYPLLVDKKRPRSQSAPIPTPLSSKYPSATLLAAPSFPRERPAASENWIGSDSKCGRSIQKRFIERGLSRDTRDIYRHSIDRQSISYHCIIQC